MAELTLPSTDPKSHIPTNLHGMITSFPSDLTGFLFWHLDFKLYVNVCDKYYYISND